MTITTIKPVKVSETELEAVLHKWTADAWSVLSICYLGLSYDVPERLFLVIFVLYRGQ